ncbi:universal stress protein [Chloroflexota bacterium]
MYKKILVPLDGSKLAECSLLHAANIAKAFAAEIVLVSVTERVKSFAIIDDPSQSLGVKLMPEATGKLQKQAQRYLDRVAKGLELQGIKITTDVQLWHPAEGIIESALLHKCDMIVIASHGRSGVSKWTHGSTAEKVFRASNIPVLMIKAPGSETVKK